MFPVRASFSHFLQQTGPKSLALVCVLPWRTSYSRPVSGLLEALLRQYYYSKCPYICLFSFMLPQRYPLWFLHTGTCSKFAAFSPVSVPQHSFGELCCKLWHRGRASRGCGALLNAFCPRKLYCQCSFCIPQQRKLCFCSLNLRLRSCPMAASVQGLSVSITAPCQLSS